MSSLITLENSVILPGKDHPDLLVSLPLTCLKQTYDQAENSLRLEDSFMLPLPLFPGFLRMLRDGDKVYNGNGHELGSYLAKVFFDNITAKSV